MERDGTHGPEAQAIFLSQALGGDYVGLEETADGVWSIYFYDVLLARLDERTPELDAAWQRMALGARVPTNPPLSSSLPQLDL